MFSVSLDPLKWFEFLVLSLVTLCDCGVFQVVLLNPITKDEKSSQNKIAGKFSLAQTFAFCLFVCLLACLFVCFHFMGTFYVNFILGIAPFTFYYSVSNETS